MENELRKRKQVRLSGYNYSSAGAYFVTICTQDRRQILSEIIWQNNNSTVGDDAHGVPKIRLSETGRTVEKHLLSSENIPGVKIDCYVIMPDHIHAIIILEPTDGTPRASSPTERRLPHVISVFKRFCNKEIGYNVFQRSYIDHIIRDKDDYIAKRRYIYENPIRWYYKQMDD